MKVPPLPTEQGGSTIGARHLWLILVPHQPKERIYVHDLFVSLFGREPDRLYSPEESATEFWWLGWVTKKEAQEWVEQNPQQEKEKQNV